MPWVEIFVVMVVCHLFGDFILQTEFQALNKRGGLGRSAIRRRALLSHTLFYLVSFVPALIWLADDLGAAGAIALGFGVAIPHMIQDDGRLLSAWVRTVKRTDPRPGVLLIMVDQSFHMVALLFTAIIVGT